MDRHPEGHPAWLEVMNPNRVIALMAPLAGDPYHPEIPPIVPDDPLDEEDPEEDPEGYQSGDDYVPADIPDFGPDEAEESEPEECLTEEEDEILVPIYPPRSLPQPIVPISPPRPLPQPIVPISPPRPYFEPYLSGGKGPMLMRTPGPSVPVVPTSSTLPDRPICGEKRKATDDPTHFEIGESSQAPPPVVPDAQAHIAALTERIRVLENHVLSTRASALTTDRRVLRLEEEEKDDAAAIQIVYHRVNAVRAEVQNHHALIGNLQHNGHMVDHQMDAAERRIVILQEEYLQLQVKFEELTRYLADRFGR